MTAIEDLIKLLRECWDVAHSYSASSLGSPNEAACYAIGDRLRVEIDKYVAALLNITKEHPRFYFDGVDYIFEREDDGNNQMICEVRGLGAGILERNAKLVVDALNTYHALNKKV